VEGAVDAAVNEAAGRTDGDGVARANGGRGNGRDGNGRVAGSEDAGESPAMISVDKAG
jgi:hypothetical protein